MFADMGITEPVSDFLFSSAVSISALCRRAFEMLNQYLMQKLTSAPAAESMSSGMQQDCFRTFGCRPARSP